MTDTDVEPYREITFDSDGDANPQERDALAGLDVTDLLMFAHGWNSSRKGATALYRRFFSPVPGLLTGARGVRAGYAGILWPSMSFADEPIPDFKHQSAVAAGPGLDPESLRSLLHLFPDREDTVQRLAELLAEQPEERGAFDEFGLLIRQLVEVPVQGPDARFASDTGVDDGPQSDPAMLYEDTLSICTLFSDALAETGADPQTLFGGGLKRLWGGAKELLRQATYYSMKRRAGTVGQLGLGPLLGHLAQARPGMRVHLIGHSQGARLVSFGLRGLPGGVHNVRSLTLLEGAFSHYAFAAGGALAGMQSRVDGPVVSCYSRFDSALGVIYPIASRLAGDSAGAVADDPRWGALGHDGIQSVDDTVRLTLQSALGGTFPGSGCVNVDAAAVVRNGGPPSGAHSDICHEELAKVVLAAGRIGSA
ncbi:serine-threonine protein kinase [Streptomyces beijiangensis]|uniref:Serine-threonine protein kinase n=1 Tax=Streptomyces beijiangensis TaxID=163361 RepID=A0A939JIF2_9ACTN|nr:serine-threonine protein kinase [Streptomyces beijiangensis]MBO0513632.1 serine-threonine protein kinase [Streptomyces beijiangensis]